MITQKDLDIENKSYINKDFATIYPELLSLAQKLTNKWNPETTDEADPGLVLLKLAAFIGDKTNYNIDKNILERFIPSATQESSARALYDMLGYNIRYYNSDTTKISFKYFYDKDDQSDAISQALSNGDNIVMLKAFDTSFKTSENVVYTLLEDVTFSKSEPLCTDKLAIQGELKCLTTSVSSTDKEALKVTLMNLDENNRIYFPDRFVAENGVFINKQFYTETSIDDWRRVDNLNDQDLGTKAYKFGFDSAKNLPYLEFPQDIASLIGDGIEIWYVTTNGASGHVANNSLTELNNYKFVVNGSELSVGNVSSEKYAITNSLSSGGSNPETLTEAYNNFKKTIGTFNTLVSKRDYSNAIYTATKEDGSHFVSADHIEDSLSNVTRAKTVLSRDNAGLSEYIKVNAGDYKTPATPENSIFLYATKPISGSILSTDQYNKTYLPISQSEKRSISNELENYKIINQEIKIPQDDKEDGFFQILNKYKLSVNVVTKYKVNEIEQTAIIYNIKVALYNAFNARNIDYGEEIPYDEIVNVCQNADARIKYVFVDRPTITPYVFSANTSNGGGKKISETSDKDKYIKDNILAGRIPYVVDKGEFSYNYNYKDIEEYEKVKSISAAYSIEPNTMQPLKENESLQILSDSYLPTVTYPAYVFYNIVNNSNPTQSIQVSDGSYYKLGSNDTLYIYYTDSTDTKKFLKYGKDTVIRPQGFDLNSTTTKTPVKYADFNNKKLVDKATNDSTPLYALGTSESIEICKKNETTLSDFGQKYYFILNPTKVNNNGTLLKFNSDGYYILEEGEYFFYPNEDATSLVILGSGTKIEYTGGDLEVTENKETTDQANLNENLQNILNEADVSLFESIFNWQIKDFSKNKLKLSEMSLSNAVESDKVTSSSLISNEWSKLTAGNIKVEETGGKITEQKATTDFPLYVRTVLNIVGSSNKGQKVEVGQTVKVGDTIVPAGTFFQIFPTVDFYNNVYLGDSSTYRVITYKEIADNDSSDSSETLKFIKTLGKKNARGECVISFDDIVENKGSYIHVVTTNDIGYTVTLNLELLGNNNLSMYVFNSATQETSSYVNKEVKLSFTKEEIGKGYAFYLSPIKQYIKSDNLNAITINSKKFDYTAVLNKSKLIENEDYLSAGWFFDKNNIYNPYTIACIDFKDSVFKVVGASQK